MTDDIFRVLLVVLSALLFYLFALYFRAKKKADLRATENSLLREEIAKVRSQKKSSEVRLGQIAEQLTPFLNNFKYDPKTCQFLGQPIDYVVFSENEIVFVEVKTGNSQLSKSQKNIRENINKKRVRFEEIRIK